jgi:hypothetical protein
MSKKFIIFAVIIIVVISPGAGWVLANATNPSSQVALPDENVHRATKEELLKAAQTEQKASHFRDSDAEAVKILSIQSYKVYDTWWYILNVTTDGQTDGTQPMIVNKFYDGPNAIRIITNPGEDLPFRDIPYDVIDNYNTALDEARAGVED